MYTSGFPGHWHSYCGLWGSAELSSKAGWWLRRVAENEEGSEMETPDVQTRGWKLRGRRGWPYYG